MLIKPFYLMIAIFLAAALSCNSQQNSKYVNTSPSGDRRLTPLGCLIFGPWEVSPINSGYNVSIYHNDSLISSYGVNYNNEERNLVFQLFDGGSLKRWSKTDYVSKDWDKSKGQTIVVSRSKPKDGQIRSIYSTGKWTVNYSDSSLTVSSGSDTTHPINISAKYLLLGSGELKLSTTIQFDTLLNGKLVRCRKVLTKDYSHPWIDGFE